MCDRGVRASPASKLLARRTLVSRLFEQFLHPFQINLVVVNDQNTSTHSALLSLSIRCDSARLELMLGAALSIAQLSTRRDDQVNVKQRFCGWADLSAYAIWSKGRIKRVCAAEHTSRPQRQHHCLRSSPLTSFLRCELRYLRHFLRTELPKVMIRVKVGPAQPGASRHPSEHRMIGPGRAAFSRRERLEQPFHVSDIGGKLHRERAPLSLIYFGSGHEARGPLEGSIKCDPLDDRSVDDAGRLADALFAQSHSTAVA